MTTVDLKTRVPVVCSGVHCGNLTTVIVDNEQDRITDLVIDRAFLQKKRRIVPVALTEATEDTCVYLCVSVDGLQRYPEYNETEFSYAPKLDR